LKIEDRERLDAGRGGAGRGLALEYLAAARRARKARRSCGTSGDGQRRGGSEERQKRPPPLPFPIRVPLPYPFSRNGRRETGELDDKPL